MSTNAAFKSVFEVAHLALEDAADEAFLGGALDVEFLQLAILGHRDARFERLGVDDDFLVDALLRADEPLDFLDDVGGGGADGFDQPFRLFGDFHRFELFLDLRGDFRVRLDEILFVGDVRGR